MLEEFLRDYFVSKLNFLVIYDECKLSQWNLVEMDTKTNSHIDSSDLKSNIMFDLARGGIELDFRSCRNFP